MFVLWLLFVFRLWRCVFLCCCLWFVCGVACFVFVYDLRSHRCCFLVCFLFIAQALTKTAACCVCLVICFSRFAATAIGEPAGPAVFGDALAIVVQLAAPFLLLRFVGGSAGSGGIGRFDAFVELLPLSGGSSSSVSPSSFPSFVFTFVRSASEASRSACSWASSW